MAGSASPRGVGREPWPLLLRGEPGAPCSAPPALVDDWAPFRRRRSGIRYSARKSFPQFVTLLIGFIYFSYFGIATIWVYSFCEGYENTEPSFEA